MPRGTKDSDKKKEGTPIKDFLDRSKIIKKPPPKDPFNPDKDLNPPQFNDGGAMRRAAKRKRLKELAKESMPILEPETKKMIEDFQNDRSPKFDRRMYDQPESEGGDPKGMMKGGMTSCPNRPDGIRGGGAAIKGMKFTGVK